MKRRTFLASSLIPTLGPSFGIDVGIASANAQSKPDSTPPQNPFKPEAGAKLKVLRWKRYIEEDEEAYMANVAKFTQVTGVPVEVQHINVLELAWSIRELYYSKLVKDVVLGLDGEAYRYPSMWMQVNDLESALAKVVGPWHPICEGYLRVDGKNWQGIPMGVSGNACVYRKSIIEKAGYKEVPKDTAGFYELCKSLNSMGVPAGFALNQSRADGTAFAYWMLWAFGGKPLSPGNQSAIDSAETLAALGYAKKLYAQLKPGCVNWGDVHNNQFFMNGQISMTYNGMNLYHTAISFGTPEDEALAKDMVNGDMPLNPQGKPVECGFFLNQLIHRNTKYPNAAKAFVYFMMTPDHYGNWLKECYGYISSPAQVLDQNPVWSISPQVAAFKNFASKMRPIPWEGKPSLIAARIRGSFLIPRMFADVVIGKETPRDAMRSAQDRIKRIISLGNND